MFRGPGMRTPRTQAQKMGTKSEGFDDAIEASYDARSGHPVTAELPRQEYSGQGPFVSSGGAKPIQSKPFKI